MASNLYRFSILGETLEKALTTLQEQKGTSNEVLEKIREKFDKVANKNICTEAHTSERGRSTHTTQINAIEHEFKLHECRLHLRVSFGLTLDRGLEVLVEECIDQDGMRRD